VKWDEKILVLDDYQKYPQFSAELSTENSNVCWLDIFHLNLRDISNIS
jgi:hypothetical protein